VWIGDDGMAAAAHAHRSPPGRIVRSMNGRKCSTGISARPESLPVSSYRRNWIAAPSAGLSQTRRPRAGRQGGGGDAGHGLVPLRNRRRGGGPCVKVGVVRETERGSALRIVADGMHTTAAPASRGRKPSELRSVRSSTCHGPRVIGARALVKTPRACPLGSPRHGLRGLAPAARNVVRYAFYVATYLITWTTYGTWLHGDPRGSVPSETNRVGTPYDRGDPDRRDRAQRVSRQDGFVMDSPSREIVDRTIREHCEFRGWRIDALNVRTNHVHVVVTAEIEPEKVMGQLKAWSCRRLRERAGADRKVWARHGSTRWIKTDASFRRAAASTRSRSAGRRR